MWRFVGFTGGASIDDDDDDEVLLDVGFCKRKMAYASDLLSMLSTIAMQDSM